MVLLRPQQRVARILALIGADRVITLDVETEITSAPESAC